MDLKTLDKAIRLNNQMERLQNIVNDIKCNANIGSSVDIDPLDLRYLSTNAKNKIVEISINDYENQYKILKKEFDEL